MFRLFNLLPASPAATPPADGASESAEAWDRRRQAPLDQDRALTSQAHRWLHRVPSGVHPKRLCRMYPRIANRLAQCWDDPRQTDALLDELLTDRRGNRRGFPPVVQAELQKLRNLSRNRGRTGFLIVRRR